MNPQESKLLHVDLTERIIRCFYDVYNELGFGFFESVYHESLMIALKQRGLAVQSRVKIPVFFRGVEVGLYEADLFVEQRVVLELKALDSLSNAHESQLLNYLKATELEVGLLLNFGPKPTFKRIYFDNARKRSRPQIVEC
jgi:GxxExxY protein